MKWINAEQQVTVSIYDDEHEEYLDKIMTVEEMLDTYTNEGCPTIYSNPEQTRWISVDERLPEEGISVIGTTKFNDIYEAELYNDCGEKKWYADGNYDVPIVAWLPLPEPYTESEVEE